MAGLTGQSKQRYVADMFARIAGRYDLMNTLMTGGLHLRWKRKTARFTSRGLTGTALDIATGTGDLAFAMARCPGISHAVGVDFLPEMVSLARSKAQAKGLTGKTSLLVGDAHSLPFPDGEFVCAAAGFSLRNMADLDQALSEMVRVVCPGGRIGTLELTPLPPGKLTGPIRFYSQRLVPALGGFVAGDRAAYTYLPESVDYFREAEELSTTFTKLGLVNVGYTKLGFGSVTLHWGDKPE